MGFHFLKREEIMRTLLILSFTFFYSAFCFDMESLSMRNLCCSFYDAKARCASECAGKSCYETCESRCGVANSLCWSSTCQEVNYSGCTSTAAPTPAPVPSTCAAGGTQCFQNGMFIDGVSCCSGFVCTPATTTDGYCTAAP